MSTSLKTYTIPAFGLLLRDAPDAALTDAERQFNDLFHLFLNRFARLTYDSSLSAADAAALQQLLTDVIAARQQLDNAV